MNDNRKQAIVNEMIRSIESKGLVADARGKMWVVDRADNESTLGLLSTDYCFCFIFNYTITCSCAHMLLCSS